MELGIKDNQPQQVGSNRVKKIPTEYKEKS